MDSVTEAAQTGFDGADLTALRGYCERLGLKFSKSHNGATLRKMLIDAMSEDSDHYGEVVEETPEDIADAKRLKAMGLARLNLRAQAGWQGRRRMVILHRSMDHESTRPQFMAWGRLHCYVPMGVECAIPYPIWNILQLTAGKRMVRKRKTDDEGRIYFETSWVPSMRFMFSDLGDDPKTADKPKDMLDMLAQLCELTDEFKGYSEAQFREMCHLTAVRIKPDWGPEQIKLAVMERIGVRDSRIELGAADGGVLGLAQAAG